MRVIIVGPGKVGSALARAFASTPHEVLAVIGRGAAVPRSMGEAGAVLVCVPDGAISGVAAALAASGLLAPDAAVLHTAGALGTAALSALTGAAHAGTFHPLQSFATAQASPPLQGVPFALGGDAQARAVGETLARAIGGVPIVVADEQRALYHAAAVLACGHVALLADAASTALAAAAGLGTDEALRMLSPILCATTRNLLLLGLPTALTGPVARGDEETIARHHAALATLAPGLAAVYAALVASARGS